MKRSIPRTQPNHQNANSRNQVELYNLKYDISEKNNLVASYPSKSEQLLDKLAAWRSSMKAPIPKEPNPDFRKQKPVKPGRIKNK
ncbi:MAG: hypothetical protein ACI9SQ_002183 [Rubritalea sp.]|jgi:hypothetical protein